jgi:hypothetical protein
VLWPRCRRYDPELRSVLREWEAPEVPASLDARVLDSYRRKMNPEPFWRRFFTSSVRVPLPLAVAVMALLVIALTLALTRPVGQPLLPAQYVQAPAADPPIVARTSLAGFEPAEELSVSVVTEQVK